MSSRAGLRGGLSNFIATWKQKTGPPEKTQRIMQQIMQGTVFMPQDLAAGAAPVKHGVRGPKTTSVGFGTDISRRIGSAETVQRRDSMHARSKIALVIRTIGAERGRAARGRPGAICAHPFP